MKFDWVGVKVILNIDHSKHKKNKQIIEIKGVNSKIIISALQLIRCKLSIKTYIFNQKSR